MTVAPGLERRASHGAGWRLVDLLIAVRRGTVRSGAARLGGGLLLLPAVALVGLLVTGLVIMASRSLHDYDAFLARQGGWSFTQYDVVLHNNRFREVLERTTMMAVITTAIAVALAIPLALTLGRTPRRWLRLTLLVVVFLPVLTGDITRTYGWLVVLQPDGPVSWLTDAVGIGRLDVLGTLWAVGIGTVQVQLPVAVLVLLPAVVLIDPELEAAARTLGAAPAKVFRHVVLPQLRPALVGAAAVGFAMAMTEFANPQLLGQGLRDYLGNYLYGTYLGNDNQSRGAAVGLLMLLAVAIGAGLILVVGRRRRRAA